MDRERGGAIDESKTKVGGGVGARCVILLRDMLSLSAPRGCTLMLGARPMTTGQSLS